VPHNALADDSDSDTSEEERDGGDRDESKKDREGGEDSHERERAAASGAIRSGVVELTMTSTLGSYSQLSFVLQPEGNADINGTLTNWAWGLSTNSVTFEFGYGLSSHAFLGGLLELGGSTLETDVKDLAHEKISTARFLVGPRFEYLFSDSGTVRPFVLGVLGFTWAPQQNTNQSISLSGFQALAGVGLHWHITPNFSIDPALRAGGGIGWGRINQGPYHDTPAHGSLLTAGAVLGVTGWVL
jgi:hypothetical protein